MARVALTEQTGGIKHLTWRNPNEIAGYGVFVIYGSICLVVLAVAGHLAWACAGVVSGIAAIAYGGYRFRNSLEIGADETGLMLLRRDGHERVVWADVVSVHPGKGGNWKQGFPCVVRFCRDTLVGQVVQFYLPPRTGWNPGGHPLVLWMQERVERARAVKN